MELGKGAQGRNARNTRDGRRNRGLNLGFFLLDQGMVFLLGVRLGQLGNWLVELRTLLLDLLDVALYLGHDSPAQRVLPVLELPRFYVEKLPRLLISPAFSDNEDEVLSKNRMERTSSLSWRTGGRTPSYWCCPSRAFWTRRGWAAWRTSWAFSGWRLSEEQPILIFLVREFRGPCRWESTQGYSDNQESQGPSRASSRTLGWLPWWSTRWRQRRSLKLLVKKQTVCYLNLHIIVLIILFCIIFKIICDLFSTI